LRGYGNSGVVDGIRAAGGEIYAITSEPQRLASQAEDEWELAFASIGDPHHEISNSCRERGLLELFVNTETRLVRADGSETYSHPKGYFQPGVLALNADGRVLYRWQGRPTRRNMGGATERPTAEHVFKNVSRALAAAASSSEPVDAELDTMPELDSRGIPWPLFVSLLVANGWFIKPKPFPFISGGPPVQQRAKRALLRVPFFVAGWAIAFAQLPVLLVGLAFAAWAAWLTPQIRFINSQFQNEPGDE
jgi:hypothetical protein